MTKSIRDPGPPPAHLSERAQAAWERERALILAEIDEQTGGGRARAAAEGPLDARELDRDSMLALLAGMGIDHNPVEVREPTRTEIDPRVLARRRAAEEEARRQREEQLASGVIDARAASPAEVAARLKQITGLDLSPSEFTRVPPPAPPKPDFESTRQDRMGAARYRLAQKLLIAKSEGRPLDARRLDPDEFEIYAQTRGLQRGTWDHVGRLFDGTTKR
jgi:hypothetical protein